MRMDISGRQSGKTRKMIRWLNVNPDAIMLTFSEAEAERLRDLYDPDRDREIYNRIVSVHSYMKTRNTSFFRPQIGVDNAELVLQNLLGDVTYITMTDPEYGD